MTFQAFTVPWLRLYVTAIYVHGDPADRASRWGFVPGGRALSNEGACLAQTMVDPAHNPCRRGGLRARRGRGLRRGASGGAPLGARLEPRRRDAPRIRRVAGGRGSAARRPEHELVRIRGDR